MALPTGMVIVMFIVFPCNPVHFWLTDPSDIIQRFGQQKPWISKEYEKGGLEKIQVHKKCLQQSCQKKVLSFPNGSKSGLLPKKSIIDLMNPLFHNLFLKTKLYHHQWEKQSYLPNNPLEKFPLKVCKPPFSNGLCCTLHSIQNHVRSQTGLQCSQIPYQ